MTAKAIARSWSMPLLRLDVGRLFAGLVGASEGADPRHHPTGRSHGPLRALDR